MLTITSIRNGIVIDHIRAGLGIRIFYQLGLDKADTSVALIMNAASTRMGRKDIIKIDSPMDVDLNALGYIDPNITINIIKDGERVHKYHPELPEKMTNLLRCNNPRCITTIEQEIDQVFRLSDRETCTYKCAYCEAERKRG